MKHKAIMVIALLALVSLMIMPASAWDLYYENEATSGDAFGYFSASFWTNASVRYVEATGINNNMDVDNVLSGSYSGVIQDGAFDPVGNYSATWGGFSIGAGHDGWVYIYFDDVVYPEDPHGNTGIVFDNLYEVIRDEGGPVSLQEFDTGYPTEVPYGAFGGSLYHGGDDSWRAGQMHGTSILYSGDPPAPVASFTCVPTSQYPNTDVVCTDTSTGIWIDEWLWTIDAEALGIKGWQTDTGQDYTWQSAYSGIYSVNLRATNSGGSDWYNRTNYVTISANATPNDCSLPVAEGYIRSMAQCVDTQTSGAIHGCNLQLNDIEGGAWSNVTERFDGTWCIDTLPLHHINAYGQATGYSSASRFNLPVSGSVMYELFMIPGYVPNASEGHVWLYVLANDYDTGAALSGATVLVSGSGEASQTRTTGLSGQVIFEWANVSTIYVTVDKSGYSSVSKVATTSDYGPDTVRVELHRVIVTPTATSTPGPGGVTPAPTLDTRSDTEKDIAMMNQVRDAGPTLIGLAIIVTIVGLLKLMAKK